MKNGYALELRFKAARSTVDIDLTLRRAADICLGNWFEFAIGPPAMDLTAAPYDGARYPVEARMDQRIFARFHLDAGIGDVVMQPFETILGRGRLGFVGIESAKVRMIALDQQFAEKIQAYFQ